MTLADKCKIIRTQLMIEEESPISVIRAAEQHLGLTADGKNMEARADAVLAALTERAHNQYAN
jgi:hypothetical protein